MLMKPTIVCSFRFRSLDVLLVALSDCLAENPQLVAAARLSLGKQPDKH